MPSLSNTKLFESSLVEVNYNLVSERTEAHSYGFNGQENDKETVGTDNGTQDYGARIYNPALGRWLSLDPLASSYSSYSPYSFSFNSPISFNDPDGKKPRVKWCTSEVTKKDGKTIITVHMQLEVKVAVINKSSTTMSKIEGEALAGALSIEAPEGSYTGSIEDDGFAKGLFNISNDPNVIVNYKVEISQSYRYVENENAAKSEEEFLILVDNHNPGLKAGGIAHSDYGAATIDINQAANVTLKNKVLKGSGGLHEVGHLFGAIDRYIRNKLQDIIDVGPKTSLMSAAQGKSIAFDNTDIGGIVNSVLSDLSLDKQKTSKGFQTQAYKLVGETYVPRYNMSVQQRVAKAIQFSQSEPAKTP